MALSAGAAEYTTPMNVLRVTFKSDDEASVMQELWGMLSTPSLPSHPSSLWPGVVALNRVLSMG